MRGWRSERGHVDDEVFFTFFGLVQLPEARLASISTDVDMVSASTIWTPTLTPASSDVDANFSDLHALQSPELRGQASPAIGERSPTAIRPSHHLSGPWLREVDVAERQPVRTSRDVTSGRSSRPRHCKDLYFPHHRLWIMEYSCKVWCKPCRRRLIPKQRSRLSWRL
ncbi:hypothetical protein Taro_014836, partial [Colocasia esculenta]|nr:hypothetical protein [Colocasia esculenta]